MTDEDLGWRVERLEQRLREIEPLVDERDIGRLMHRYIEACDHVHDPAGIASMFTADAVWEGANRYVEFGTTKGRDAIEAMFAATPDVLPFTVHWLTNAVIDVAPDRATAHGDWEVVQAATFGLGRVPVWVAARYSNDFVRTPAGWLIHHLRYADIFVTPFGEGWEQTVYVSPFTGDRRRP